jgi:hypothetical protein
LLLLLLLMLMLMLFFLGLLLISQCLTFCTLVLPILICSALRLSSWIYNPTVSGQLSTPELEKNFLSVMRDKTKRRRFVTSLPAAPSTCDNIAELWYQQQRQRCKKERERRKEASESLHNYRYDAVLMSRKIVISQPVPPDLDHIVANSHSMEVPSRTDLVHTHDEAGSDPNEVLSPEVAIHRVASLDSDAEACKEEAFTTGRQELSPAKQTKSRLLGEEASASADENNLVQSTELDETNQQQSQKLHLASTEAVAEATNLVDSAEQQKEEQQEIDQQQPHSLRWVSVEVVNGGVDKSPHESFGEELSLEDTQQQLMWNSVKEFCREDEMRPLTKPETNAISDNWLANPGWFCCALLV